MARERIAIIGGSGDQGKGLALRWARAGYEIIIGSRDHERAAAAADDIRQRVGGEVAASGAVNAEASRAAPTVVLTVPFAAQAATLGEIREQLSPGTLFIDVTVPLANAVGGKLTQVLGVWDGSAAEQAARILGDRVEVVSAFHNAGAGALQDIATPVECDILVCGNSKSAKEKTRALVEVISGCRFVDAGPLSNSRTVEAITALLVGVNIRYKTHSGIRITGV
jgi:NADPH-dependent F420 reductase